MTDIPDPSLPRITRRPHLLGLALLALVFVDAQVDFTPSDTAEAFESARARAEEENKALFVDFYTDWCGYCKMMDREVFAAPEVGEMMNASFVNVKVDAESEFGDALAAEYGVGGFPTYIWMDANGDVIARNVGYSEKAEFIASVAKAKRAYALKARIGSSIEAGELTRDESRDYAVAIADADAVEAQKYANQYLENIRVEEILDAANLDFISLFGTGLDGTVFDYVKDHSDAFREAHGQAGLDQYVKNTYNRNLSDAILASEPDRMEAVVERVVPLLVESERELAQAEYVTRKIYYGNIGLATEYARLVDAFHAEHARDRPYFYFNEAYEVVESYASQPALVRQAVGWLNADKADARGVDSYMLSAYANGILGEFERAREDANKALELADTAEQEAMAKEILGMIEQATAGE